MTQVSPCSASTNYIESGINESFLQSNYITSRATVQLNFYHACTNTLYASLSFDLPVYSYQNYSILNDQTSKYIPSFSANRFRLQVRITNKTQEDASALYSQHYFVSIPNASTISLTSLEPKTQAEETSNSMLYHSMLDNYNTGLFAYLTKEQNRTSTSDTLQLHLFTLFFSYSMANTPSYTQNMMSASDSLLSPFDDPPYPNPRLYRTYSIPSTLPSYYPPGPPSLTHSLSVKQSPSYLNGPAYYPPFSYATSPSTPSTSGSPSLYDVNPYRIFPPFSFMV